MGSDVLDGTTPTSISGKTLCPICCIARLLCDETIHFFFENGTFKVALYCMKPLFKCEFIFLPHSHFGRFFGKIEHIPKSSSKHYEN